MRALITGIGGFAGSHLADYLLAETNWQLVGCVLNECDLPRHLAERLACRPVDLRDEAAVRRMLDETAPDLLFHLAALANVGSSWSNPWPILKNNVLAQLNLLEGLVKLGAQPRLLVVSSNEVYGLVRPDELPVSEENPLRPNNPYAVSKLTQDMLALQYYLSYQLPIVRVRPFNHVGPRQAPGFVAPDFARQIAQAEAGQRPPRMQVGNLQARRDFTDVRDMVRAYYLAATQGSPGEVYNLGSGKSHPIQALLDILLSYSQIEITIEPDPARLRPSDVPEVRCDAGKFRTLTGWEPSTPFEASLRDVLDDWRKRVRHA